VAVDLDASASYAVGVLGHVLERFKDAEIHRGLDLRRVAPELGRVKIDRHRADGT